VIMILSGTFEQLLTYIGFAPAIVPFTAVAGVLLLRRREPMRERPYRVLGVSSGSGLLSRGNGVDLGRGAGQPSWSLLDGASDGRWGNSGLLVHGAPKAGRAGRRPGAQSLSG
jgi:hypothetical protein